MSYHLLTGATGLLGRYLLRDLTLADVPLVVVVRSSRTESAEQRIETAMSSWEQQLGRALVRPVVMEGDISQPNLGLDATDINWLSSQADAMIHSAASLTFHADEEDGEPWRSNVGGTRHALELCRRANIRQMHHVSTAYVCGQRRGQILETELDEGQQLGNDYERTKVTAEKEVRASDCFDCVTVHRPSIIVGDSDTGYTTSYHGFYTPLRLVHAVTMAVPWEEVLQQDWMGGLDLSGEERKNLVPVNWVSAAMTWLISHPETHGQTYHLTNPKPATVADMLFAFTTALARVASQNKPATNGLSTSELFASYREQMKVYQSYWSDDPEFDSRNTTTAMPHLSCPEITEEVMQRLIDFAIRSNFGWPREQTIPARFDIQSYLRPWLSTGTEGSYTNGGHRQLGLRVSGSGGGQWQLVVNHGRLVAAEAGRLRGDGATCHLTSNTFSQLVSGRLSCETAINAGKLVVTGNAVHPCEIERLFRNITPNNPTN